MLYSHHDCVNQDGDHDEVPESSAIHYNLQTTPYF